MTSIRKRIERLENKVGTCSSTACVIALPGENSSQAVVRYRRRNPHATGPKTVFLAILTFSDKPPTSTGFARSLRGARQRSGRDDEAWGTSR